MKLEIEKLNQNIHINGIIVQIPLDSEFPINADSILNTVDPMKDVDGLNSINSRKIAIGQFKDSFTPCTPKGCIEMIKSVEVNFKGLNAVVIGKNKLVGIPMADLLKLNHSNVLLCHSNEKDLKQSCKQADLIVIAIGKPKFIKQDWIKPGAIVIDVGINIINSK